MACGDSRRGAMAVAGTARRRGAVYARNRWPTAILRLQRRLLDATTYVRRSARPGGRSTLPIAITTAYRRGAWRRGMDAAAATIANSLRRRMRHYLRWQYIIERTRLRPAAQQPDEDRGEQLRNVATSEPPFPSFPATRHQHLLPQLEQMTVALCAMGKGCHATASAAGISLQSRRFTISSPPPSMERNRNRQWRLSDPAIEAPNGVCGSNPRHLVDASAQTFPVAGACDGETASLE